MAYVFAAALFIVAMMFVNALTRNLESLNERQSEEDNKLVIDVVNELFKEQERRAGIQREAWKD